MLLLVTVELYRGGRMKCDYCAVNRCEDCLKEVVTPFGQKEACGCDHSDSNEKPCPHCNGSGKVAR